MSGKYSKFDHKVVKAPYKIHPVWAGIGFMMVIIVPIMSWAGAVELVAIGRGQGWSFLAQFPPILEFPDWAYMLPGAAYLSTISDLPVIGTFFLIILICMTGILSFVYAIVYRLVGPPRYAPDDAPAPRVKVKRYSR